jgi:hypothetical protein
VDLELGIAAFDGQVRVSAIVEQSADSSVSATLSRRSGCFVLALIASDGEDLATPWSNKIPSRCVDSRAQRVLEQRGKLAALILLWCFNRLHSFNGSCTAPHACMHMRRSAQVAARIEKRTVESAESNAWVPRMSTNSTASQLEN